MNISNIDRLCAIRREFSDVGNQYDIMVGKAIEHMKKSRYELAKYECMSAINILDTTSSFVYNCCYSYTERKYLAGLLFDKLFESVRVR